MLLDINITDIMKYKDRIIQIENNIEITKEEYKLLRLNDLININQFVNTESIPLKNFSINTQNEIGLRYMNYDNFIKEYNGKRYFYLDKLLRFFESNNDIHPIILEAIKDSKIPGELYPSFNYNININLEKISLAKTNTFLPIFEISIGYRDININQDVFIRYFLTDKTNIDIDLPYFIKNTIMKISVVYLDPKIKNEYLEDYPLKLKYDIIQKKFYYESFLNNNKIWLNSNVIDYNFKGKQSYLYNIDYSKDGSIKIKESKSTFRYDNTIFSQYEEVLKNFKYEFAPFLSEYEDGFKNSYSVLTNLPELDNNIGLYKIDIKSNINNYDYVKSFIDKIQLKNTDINKYVYTEEVSENFKPIINYIDIDKIETYNLNKLLLTYFYKIFKNGNNRIEFIPKTVSLLDIDLNIGKYSKVVNLKKFILEQFSTFLKLSSDIVPFSNGFSSTLKKTLHTKFSTENEIKEEIQIFFQYLNSYYSTDFKLEKVELIEKDNGIFVQLTVKVYIIVLNEKVLLEALINR